MKRERGEADELACRYHTRGGWKSGSGHQGLLRLVLHRASIWPATPPIYRSLEVEEVFFYGDWNSEVVQRREGVRIHHP